MEEISEAEKELGDRWIAFWTEAKNNCSEHYCYTMQGMLNRMRSNQLNNPEVWVKQFLMYMDELKASENYSLFTEMPYLPDKPMSEYWSKAFSELGYETVQSYGALLYAAARRDPRRKSKKNCSK